MSLDPPRNLVLTAPAAAALRDDFIGWQCRIRQLSARQAGGRPIPGMRPRVLAPHGHELSPAITVLIVEADPANSTALFKHQYLKTNDPIERYDKVLEILSGTYFQRPADFAEILQAKPGITGLSQLAYADERKLLRPDDPVGDYVARILPQKCALDRLYVAGASVRRDLGVLWWTIVAVLLRRQVAVHRTTGALGLRRRPT